MAFVSILFVIAGLMGLVAWVWLLIAAFRIHVGWAVAIFFLSWTLIPVIVFAVRNWPEVRRPVVLYAGALMMSFIAGALAVFAVGLELGSVVTEGGGLIPGTATEGNRDDGVLPPPRPTALPTHPSWEAVVEEMDRDTDAGWESFVPSPTPATGPRPGGLTWDELGALVGRKVVVELTNNTVTTAALEGVEPDRIRVRHNIGGGEASYWIERDQVARIALPRP